MNGRPLRGPDGEVSGGVIVFRDVSDRKRSDAAVARAFESGRLTVIETLLHNIGNAMNSVGVGLSTVGQLAGDDKLEGRLDAVVVALRARSHDLADFLTTDPQGRRAIPFLEAIADDLRAWRERLRAAAERATERAIHITEILRNQRTGARRGDEAMDMRLDEAVRTAAAVLEEHARTSGVAVQIDCSRGPGRIRVREALFHQAVVNLMKNGIESASESAGGGAGTDRWVRVSADLDDDAVIIEVADNGKGIAPQEIERLGTPGYTTKAEGSGIGLHAVQSFAAACLGRLDIESDGSGKGATMRLRLGLAAVLPNR